MGMKKSEESVDFFISYATRDRAWAEWIAWQLETAGYSVVVQAWDFRPGRDFLHEMQRATTTAKKTLAVLSPHYFASKFSEAEWRTVFAKDPTGERGLLVPVRISEFQPPGLLATRVYIDLVGMSVDDAKDALLRGLAQRGARPTREPSFPGAASISIRGGPRFPGRIATDRLMIVDTYANALPGYITIMSLLDRQGRSRDIEGDIAIKLRAYESLHELLDDVYLHYLRGRVAPYSYGSAWLILTPAGTIAAPWEWG